MWGLIGAAHYTKEVETRLVEPSRSSNKSDFYTHNQELEALLNESN